MAVPVLPQTLAKGEPSYRLSMSYITLNDVLRAPQPIWTTKPVTAARSGEARGALWDEIDLKRVVWTIPGRRANGQTGMKSGKVHRVPLSESALAILHEVAEFRTGPLVFFGARAGRPLSDTTLL